MVIIMGARMDRHKKKNKHRGKVGNIFKFILVMLLISSLVLLLIKLDLDLRNSTGTQRESIYNLSFSEDIINIELLGKKYYVDKEEVNKLIENLKSTLKRLKDQSALVF